MIPSYYKIKILVKCRAYSTLGAKGIIDALAVSNSASLHRLVFQVTTNQFGSRFGSFFSCDAEIEFFQQKKVLIDIISRRFGGFAKKKDFFLSFVLVWGSEFAGSLCSMFGARKKVAESANGWWGKSFVNG